MTLHRSLALVALLLGCRDPTPTSSSSPTPGASAPTSVKPTPVTTPWGDGSAVTTPGGDGSAEDELSTQPMELLRFRFTSGVEGREPKDELREARPGQRVYAFLALRNRTGRDRKITLAWTVDGAPRTTLDLEIDESWQYRTWGYNTVAPTDRGALRLEVTDDAGHPIVERELPIRP